MHIPTHVMSGWCIGASLPLTARERLVCVLMASGADLDGISLAWGRAAYRRWHHVLGHNVFFGLLLALLCARFLAAPGRRLMMTALGLALFHVHLVLDYYGSGSGWPIYYWRPFCDSGWVNSEAWEFGGWQSYATMAGLLIWTTYIALSNAALLLNSWLPAWRMTGAICSIDSAQTPNSMQKLRKSRSKRKRTTKAFAARRHL